MVTLGAAMVGGCQARGMAGAGRGGRNGHRHRKLAKGRDASGHRAASMKIADMTWADVEIAARRDPRAVLPLGSTEQHAQLSLCVDAILAERVAVEAAEPLGVPVYPVMPYGLAPYFTAYPGTVSLRVETLLAVARDVLASIRRAGFRRILIVNGHGGNAPVGALAQELMADWPDTSIRFHNWWSAPRTWAMVEATGPASHPSWMENFPESASNDECENGNFGEIVVAHQEKIWNFSQPFKSLLCMLLFDFLDSFDAYLFS